MLRQRGLPTVHAKDPYVRVAQLPGFRVVRAMQQADYFISAAQPELGNFFRLECPGYVLIK